ncbi:MAG: hypothetical protein KU37_05990 [Sulfuricurvum sp. PC08-66]|nr:MAG: hypothetical protein KU37_05990 [Sulfuricurvum sp. PC08-66]
MKHDTLLPHHPHLVAFFTHRHGGESRAPYASNNLAFHVGDDPDSVTRNREALRASIEGCEKIVAMNQVHGCEVCHVDTATQAPTADALTTQERGVALMVMVADCTPLLWYDTQNEAIAAVHAGRAGALGNIVASTYETMHARYGSQASHIEVVMGPSIRSCCYAIGPKEVEQTRQKGYDFALLMREGQAYLDIEAILLSQLGALGITHIVRSEVCTACDTQNYFSYRKEGVTGRFSGVIMLK